VDVGQSQFWVYCMKGWGLSSSIRPLLTVLLCVLMKQRRRLF